MLQGRLVLCFFLPKPPGVEHLGNDVTRNHSQNGKHRHLCFLFHQGFLTNASPRSTLIPCSTNHNSSRQGTLLHVPHHLSFKLHTITSGLQNSEARDLGHNLPLVMIGKISTQFSSKVSARPTLVRFRLRKRVFNTHKLCYFQYSQSSFTFPNTVTLLQVISL